MKGGCLDLTVFQDDKPLITYFIFPQSKIAFRKFRSGRRRGEVEEVEYRFAFNLCKELCKFRDGKRVEGTFVQWLKSKQQKQKRRGKEDVMSVLFREGKVELSGLVFVRR
ncbi:MAG: hypothetical protein ACTSVR_03255 [Candidatus Thorarchaeota archaeon]